jgi:bifunctional UDP-N-acetylglucosamine pyrophosphorylase / glucosamine-1-phosphate N-acetyltransferase
MSGQLWKVQHCHTHPEGLAGLLLTHPIITAYRSGHAWLDGVAMLTIVLAAGKGTRMKSDIPKPLHRVGGLSLLAHAMAIASQFDGARLAVVIGPDMEAVGAAAKCECSDAEIFVQKEQRGTADAVAAAAPAIVANGTKDVLVLFCDTPLLRSETLERLRRALDAGASLAVLGFEPADPTGYGRIVRDAEGNVNAIREDRDASQEERAVKLCNGGVMAFRHPDLVGVLNRIGNTNAKQEFYLTDAIEIVARDGLRVAAVTCNAEEVAGINDRAQLAQAEAVFQARARIAAMAAGVTMIAPETVWFSYDTVLGRDVVIEPNVVFGPGVVVADRATIRANSCLEHVTVGADAVVGPLARLAHDGDRTTEKG